MLDNTSIHVFSSIDEAFVLSFDDEEVWSVAIVEDSVMVGIKNGILRVWGIAEK